VKIEVQRKWVSGDSICGELSVDGQFECFSLERPRTGEHSCIPAATYDVVLTFSPHLGYVTPEILNVPARTAIRIHIANKASELLGCTAVGETHSPDFVGNSHDAFASLMILLRTAVDAITIEYLDPLDWPVPDLDSEIAV
jgi:Family of unknown function (DUF5675)